MSAAILLAACQSIPSPAERLDHAAELAAARAWIRHDNPAGEFTLVSFEPRAAATDDTLTVYIEGDGYAWLTPHKRSADPTPIDPLALRLALAQPVGRVAYLARPCQFIGAQQPPCAKRYWSDGRFAAELIDASQLALDQIKARAAARRLILVGYSGGGAIAVLLAAHRSDVASLVTVAGNLDHRAWAAHHRFTRLDGSLNPADFADQVAGLKQVHFTGARDEVVPPALAQRLPAGLIGAGARNLHVVPNVDHRCCWVEHWPALWQEIQRSVTRAGWVEFPADDACG
jgi:dienelactone hydrolase